MSVDGLYKVDLPIFKGPIEVLYRLIQKEELDITEISLAYITEKFILYIEKYEAVIQEEIHSFLNIVSHLIYLKSKYLLPLEIDDPEELENISYTDDLLERILFFSRLEKGINFLENQFNSWNYIRGENLYKNWLKGQNSLTEISLLELIEETVPWLSENTNHYHLVQGKIKVLFLGIEERWEWIISKILVLKSSSFNDLIKELPKVDKIISFLAILEKIKTYKIIAKQDDLFGNIYLEEIKNE